MARKMNIVLFSSGVSERSGLVGNVRDGLMRRGFSCVCWKDLFANARDANHIALLPMLIKKIPTFDYAVIICEGHDKTLRIQDGKQVELNTMRDNVLFEIGMCTVALGVSKVILITDSRVHLPDDLAGISGEIAVKHLVLEKTGKDALEQVLDSVKTHVEESYGVVTPVVIGAAASTASGYVTNFILRTLEKIGDGFNDKATGQMINPGVEHLRMEIYIPFSYDIETPVKARTRRGRLRTGVLTTARQRAVEFTYALEGDSVVIIDYPTTLITSYNTAKIILNLNADDTNDPRAELRFNEKELDLFEATLRSLLGRFYIEAHVAHYYPQLNDDEQKNMVNYLLRFIDQRLTIIREDY